LGYKESWPRTQDWTYVNKTLDCLILEHTLTRVFNRYLHLQQPNQAGWLRDSKWPQLRISYRCFLQSSLAFINGFLYSTLLSHSSIAWAAHGLYNVDGKRTGLDIFGRGWLGQRMGD
jgi:hypothetical protein